MGERTLRGGHAVGAQMPYANNAGIGLNYDAVGDGPPAVLVHANPFDWRL